MSRLVILSEARGPCPLFAWTAPVAPQSVGGPTQTEVEGPLAPPAAAFRFDARPRKNPHSSRRCTIADMLPLLEQILRKQEVLSADGTPIPLHSAITEAEGAKLQQLIAQKCPVVSLEIGLAYGVSALFICEALSKAGGERHIVIDPGQEAWFQGIGLRHLKEAGFGPLIDFRQQKSHNALPQLVTEGVRIDFAFVDGFHTFDHVLVDFFYVDLLLRVGGIIAFDDANSPPIHTVCRYVATNRAYRVCGEVGTMRHKGLAARTLCWSARRSAILRRILRSRFSEPDEALGFSTDSSLIAFEKISEDTRKWDFDRDF